MGLNDVVSGERLHIGFYGMRNAGKSSLVNAVTGQELSVVSPIKGTTTDPVKKAMELLPLGPVVILDTPGLDDEGELGELRVRKTKEMLSKTDIAVLVADGTVGLSDLDIGMAKELSDRGIPYITVYNKADLFSERDERDVIYVSAVTGEGVETLKEKLGEFAKRDAHERFLVKDLLEAGDTVVLVTPIDESAPKGRLILPQQMTLRDVLDAHASAVTCQVEELEGVLSMLLKKPRMVITDSQAFGKVSKIVPRDVPLTSFSILMARYKGDLTTLVRGYSALRSLSDGDLILISEGCTHHRQCNDIGRVKIPGWIEGFSGVKPRYEFTSGGEFPQDLSPYKMIVHCGGCMLNEAEMKNRMGRAKAAGVPMVNYGIAIAVMHGILERSVELFPDILK